MKKIILTLLFILLINKLTGQEGPYLAPIDKTIDMFPKTPDAAALSKFVDIPPGNFTGVATFTIPLYTISVDNINIPINLSYTTTGIKVGEIASRVGLGWALNTGPSLSQQVVGNRDRTLKKPILDVTTVDGSCPYETWQTYSFNNPSPCGVALSSIGLFPFEYAINPDLQPDIFSYGLLNDNGHFILDYNGEKGIPRPFNLNKIIPKTLYGQLGGMEITDQKGIIYKFSDRLGLGQIRNKTTCNPDNEEDDIPNFKLDSIIVTNNKKIYYSYTKSISTSYITSITEDKIIDKQIVGTVKPEYYPPERCINKTVVSNDLILRDITFEGGKVIFYYNNDSEGFTEQIRKDLRGDAYLTRVVVKNNNNNIIKDISLTYNYFESNDSAPVLYQNYLNNSPEIYYRLKLKGVKDNLSTSEYKLSYHGDEEGTSLPNRMSFSQDYWGVYNGWVNSSPIATLKTNSINNPKVRVFLGANKLPNINYGIIGNLKKIIYPTGGYTQISYEADDYYKEIYNPPIYDYIVHQSDETDLYMPFIEFEILNDGKPLYNQSIILYDSECPENSQGYNTDSTPKWELYKKNISGIFSKVGDGFVCTTADDRPIGREDSPGIYRLKVYERSIDGAPIPPTGNRTITAKYSWINEIIVNPSSVDKIGTIRVKQIESNSSDNGKIVRKYEYKNPTTNISSGKNQGQELLMPLSMKEKDVGPNPPGKIGPSRSMKYLTRSNNPGWQLTTVRGKSVGYEYVQEIYESFLNPSENYRKQSKFNIGYSDPLYQYQPLALVNITYPQKILDSGLLLEEKSYNKNGDTIRSIRNEFEYDSYFNQFASMNLMDPPYDALNEMIGRGLEVKTKKVDTDALGGKYFHFNTNYFDIKNIWIKNVKTTTTDYVNNQPAIVIEQIKTYSNNSGQNRHTFPEKMSSTDAGSGITTSQHFKYAHDINSYLKEKNIINVPLETTVKRNNTIVSKSKVLYPISQVDADTNTMGLPLPKSILSYDIEKMNQPQNPVDLTSTEITYDKYDNKGNITQYTTKFGIPTTIIWGYSQTMPIAKLEGVEYENIKNNSLVIAIVNASNEDNMRPQGMTPEQTEQALIDALDNLRQNSDFLNYPMTTYSYDPLIGVKSVTPPSGLREIYIYDNSSRMIEVKRMEKDTSGNFIYRTLSENEYHYKP